MSSVDEFIKFNEGINNHLIRFCNTNNNKDIRNR